VIPSLAPWNVPKSLNDLFLVLYSFHTTQEKPFTISIPVQHSRRESRFFWLGLAIELSCICWMSAASTSRDQNDLSHYSAASRVMVLLPMFAKLFTNSQECLPLLRVPLVHTSLAFCCCRLVTLISARCHRGPARGIILPRWPSLVVVFQFDCFQPTLESCKLSLRQICGCPRSSVRSHSVQEEEEDLFEELRKPKDG